MREKAQAYAARPFDIGLRIAARVHVLRLGQKALDAFLDNADQPIVATIRLCERHGFRNRMGEYERGRYATVSREGIDYALQIFRLCKRAADHKAVVTGDADDIQNLRH
jgi:hypothetical protein